MRRRELILGLGGALAAPFPVRAQSRPAIGFLNSQSAATFGQLVDAFREGLQQTGYVEGQNLTVEYRWADNHLERLKVLADELVRDRVSVIAACGGPAPALAAKAATDTTPIVFTIGADPLKLGLVTSLSRPTGNITGVTF